jgi:hypothetical protein
MEGGAKDAINAKDEEGMYPLHWACDGGASVEVIRSLIEYAPGITTVSDNRGSIPVDYLDTSKAAELFGESKTGAITDKASTIDKLGYSTYAKALVKAVRIAETPESSLCVGLYGKWGSGKSTLWKHIVKHLDADFQMDDALWLKEKCGSEVENMNAADKCFKKAHAEVLDSSIIGQNEKKVFEGLRVKDDVCLPFGKWCLFHFLQKLCCRNQEEKNNDHDEESGRYNMHRRDERHALVFSVLVILSFLTVAPVLIAHVLYCYAKRSIKIDDEEKKASVDKVFDLITGEASVAKGEVGDINLWSGFVIMLLWTVQLAVHGIKSIAKAMYSWFGCCFPRGAADSATPEGLPEYARVDFNAWAYSGSDHIWASLISSLWNEVEKKFTKPVVRLHRAKIYLAGESPLQNPDKDLSTSNRKEKREAEWIKYKIKLFASAVLSIAVIAVSVFIAPLITQSIDGNNPTMDNNNSTIDNSGGDANNTDVIVTWLCASLASFPLLYQVVNFIIKIFPYLRQPMGDILRNKANAIESSKRKDFSMEKGFMGEVKREVEYLFDLLKTEKYLDKNIGCNRSLRLCVFVDDLDRCPPEIVVDVLEAVILLLVDGPITCWLAIDNRIVVECIKASKKDVYIGAEIHGHEFLDKIVQLPFCLPDLSTQHKKSFLSKIIEGNELKLGRVSSQIFSYTSSFKMEKEFGNSAYQSYRNKLKQTKNLRETKRGIRDNSSLGDKEKAITSLLDHYHVMKAMGHKINRQDCHIFGMSESDLVERIQSSIDNRSLSSVQEGHIENFCLLMKTEHDNWKTHLINKHTLSKGAVQKQTLSSGAVQKQKDTASPSKQDQSNASPIRSSIIYLPSKHLNLPMFSKTERDALDNYYQFLNGNARKLKRIVNIFNVCRSIFDHRIGSLNSIRSSLSTRDILRFVILLEQWPCRMSWLLQSIENIEQTKTFSLDTNFGLTTLEDVKDMDAASYFTKYVDRPMHDYKKSTELLLIDANPRLFLGLLRNKTALKVEDFLTSNDVGHEVLRDYAFNLPSYVKAKVDRHLAEMDAMKKEK